MQRLVTTALAVVLGIGLFVAPTNAASVTSTFDTDLEGWTSDPTAPGFVRHSSDAAASVGTQPTGTVTGHLYARDASNTNFDYVLAPASFYTINANLYGGLLRYDYFAAGSGVDFHNQVVLFGGGLTLMNRISPGLTVPTTTEFETRSFVLDENSGWKVVGTTLADAQADYDAFGEATLANATQVMNVLGGLTDLLISTDHTNLFDTNDVTRLDNITLFDSNSLPSGVPEPSSLLLCGLGMVGLAATRRRRNVVEELESAE